MNLRKIVKRNNIFNEYVNILNGILQLSKREAEVFSFLLAADANGESHNVNSKTVRRAVMNHLGISESNLSLYLATLKKLSLIVRNENRKWVINDSVRPGLVEEKNEHGDVIGYFTEINVILVINELSRQDNKGDSERV